MSSKNEHRSFKILSNILTYPIVCNKVEFLFQPTCKLSTGERRKFVLSTFFSGLCNLCVVFTLENLLQYYYYLGSIFFLFRGLTSQVNRFNNFFWQSRPVCTIRVYIVSTKYRWARDQQGNILQKFPYALLQNVCTIRYLLQLKFFNLSHIRLEFNNSMNIPSSSPFIQLIFNICCML